MFGFFKSKTPSVSVNDKIWMSTEAKWKACRDMLMVNAEIIFAPWFKATFDQLTDAIGTDKASNIIMAEQLDNAKSSNRMVVFVEHYPLAKTEQQLFIKLNLHDVPVLSSIDEPLFMLFGGERTVELMKRLGVEEGKVLGHSMISKSIARAQAKIERSVVVEQKADSQQEWFAKNLK